MERYYSFPTYCKNTFHHKLYKIPLDAGFTCPNRDGTCGRSGCIYCDEGGSGDFALKYNGQPFILEDIPYIHKSDDSYGHYIGYFQAYTNTYGPKDHLYTLYKSCLNDPCIEGISIATRPDCINEEVMEVLSCLQKEFPNKFIWVELGLQSIHETSAKWMMRGYPLSVFDEAVRLLKQQNIPIIVHVIIGLYKESEEDIYQTIQYLNQKQIQGIKLHLLHILKGSKLEAFYKTHDMHILSKEEYVRIICNCIGYLDPNIVIHRLTGDGDPDLLIAPLWSLHKRDVLNSIMHELKVLDIKQGCKLTEE